MNIATIAWFALAQGHVQFGAAAPDDGLNRLFMSQDGWIGADLATSVPISSTSTWWLFSDTWIGKIRNGSRTDATIVNNTAARMDGKKLSFIVKRAADGKPQALITPPGGSGWFWLGPGALVDRKLYLVLTQVEKTDPSSVFGFKSTGLWLGTVDRPGLTPESWTPTLSKVPFAHFDSNREVSFGFGLCQAGAWMYVYGTDEDAFPGRKERYLIAARCPAHQMGDYAKWQFWTKSGWGSDSSACVRMVNNMASDGSVSYLPKLKLYVLTYTENGLSPRILARTATSPVGPWSEPTEVYNCPDAAGDSKIFCYQARNHPELAHGNELVLSYCTNSFDFWQVAREARLYFPRFVRVPLKIGT